MYEIDYIEFWATKHCNLNCKGCSSCSPISEEWFLNVDSIERDLNRLKALDIHIKNINILGGEPLLHPNIEDIIACVKKVYPRANLGLLTNGLLLLKKTKKFWEACVKHEVMLNVTCFPVMDDEWRGRIIKKIRGYKLQYHITDKKRFNKILVLNNSEPIEDILEACGCNHAYNLYDGSVSRCTVPMVTETLNRYFGVEFLTDGRLDLYSSNAEQIMSFLSTPNKSCRNCSSRPVKVRWEKADDCPNLQDWIIGGEQNGISI